jgi:hypothetical protein
MSRLKLHIQKIRIFISSCKWVVVNCTVVVNGLLSTAGTLPKVCFEVETLNVIQCDPQPFPTLCVAHFQQGLAPVHPFFNFMAFATADRGECVSIP